MKIVVTSVYVDDQEKALRFHTDVLGFRKKEDVPTGEFRWLTVGLQQELHPVRSLGRLAERAEASDAARSHAGRRASVGLADPMQSHDSRNPDAIRRAMDLIDGADVAAWFAHCGYSGQLK